MRKFLIPLLVASALAPAAASAQDDGARGPRSEGERDSSSGDRPQRAERVQRVERLGDSDRAARMDRADRSLQTERNIQQVQEAQSVQQTRRDGGGQAVEPARQVPQVQGVESDDVGQPAQRIRRAERNDDGFAIRRVPREMQTSPETQTEANRDGDRNVEHGDRNDGHRWSGDWRSNKRYDWQNYRNRHGSLYRFGRYYDPYGWGYRRFSIGLSLWPSYYGSSFWLNDPWQYRLPPSYGPYRWVRYYDDALLVNIYTGQVVDVIHSFFW